MSSVMSTRVVAAACALRTTQLRSCSICSEGTAPYLTGFRFPFAMPSPHQPDSDELTDLLARRVAFLGEHRRCGEMDGGADEEWVWMTCTCGAIISRTLEPAHRP